MSALCTYLLSTAINLTTNTIPLEYPDMKLEVIHHDPVTVTNVTSGDNHRGCPGRPSWSPGDAFPEFYHPPHEGCTTFVPPTEKWERTLVERIEFMDVIWRGKTNRVENREIVSDNTTEWSIAQEWRMVSSNVFRPTPTSPKFESYTLTNLITATNINITVITQALWRIGGPNLTNGVFVAP